jgi:Haem-binding domain
MKRIWIALVIVFIIIQFARPEKNLSDDKKNDVSTRYEVPAKVGQVLQSACYDCHSNKTSYPWYSEVQPIGWWLNDHVEEGKSELNFSSFTTRKVAVQNHKFEEVIETVKEKEMPLPSYTWLGMHPQANLSDADRQVLIDWAQAQMDTLKARYPADSLVLRRR